MTVKEFEKKANEISKELKKAFEDLIKENTELKDVSFTKTRKYTMNVYIGYEFGKTPESFTSICVFKDLKNNKHHIRLFSLDDVDFNIIDTKSVNRE